MSGGAIYVCAEGPQLAAKPQTKGLSTEGAGGSVNGCYATAEGVRGLHVLPVARPSFHELGLMLRRLRVTPYAPRVMVNHAVAVLAALRRWFTPVHQRLRRAMAMTAQPGALGTRVASERPEGSAES
jgi:hypothetical protein